MARGRGVPGLAVGLAASGALLVYTGIRNVEVLPALRDILSGRLPEEGPQSSRVTGRVLSDIVAQNPIVAQAQRQSHIAAGATGKNGAIATAAARYLGVPYRFGGTSPSGFDCSGLVWYVLDHDIGVRHNRLITTGYLVWSGARTIPRDQCGPGDLVCWPGHMGIATDRTTMIHAPGAGQVVKRAGIWSTPAPTIRRVVL